MQTPIWEFPKIGDPNLVPLIVGSLLTGPQNQVLLNFGNSQFLPISRTSTTSGITKLWPQEFVSDLGGTDLTEMQLTCVRQRGSAECVGPVSVPFVSISFIHP